jgi:hypothetical protein
MRWRVLLLGLQTEFNSVIGLGSTVQLLNNGKEPKIFFPDILKELLRSEKAAIHVSCLRRRNLRRRCYHAFRNESFKGLQLHALILSELPLQSVRDEDY